MLASRIIDLPVSKRIKILEHFVAAERDSAFSAATKSYDGVLNAIPAAAIIWGCLTMADSSEMRALGIAAHFANVFAKEGGTLDMLNWVAHEPARMQQIVQIADTWLLVRGSSVRIKIAYCGTYNPREFFTIGEHNGVRIVRVIGNVEMFAPDETRPIQSISLVPYTARKSTNLSAVFNEVNRLKEAEVTSVDHVRAALVLSAQSRENPILAMDGNVNQFYVPHKVRIGVVHFPVRLTYILDERGWELDVPMSMGTGDIVRQGTRIILDGDKSQ